MLNDKKKYQKPIFEMNDVSYQYENKKALEHINLKIFQGEFMAIVGPNGSGKSTLLKLILGLLEVQQGEILIDGKKVKHFKHWAKIGYVSQKSNAFNHGFPATVEEVVLSGLTKSKKIYQRFNKKDKHLVKDILKEVNLEGFEHRNINELSGGQQQRVFIARTLVADPKVLVLDEPTVGIDASQIAHFYDILNRLKRSQLTILLVSHDIGIVAEQADRVACINKHLHFHGTNDEFKQLNEVDLSKIYGHPVKFVDHDHERECCK